MSAKFILNTNKYASLTESLITLNWLPIRAKIIFKNLTLVQQCIYGNTPEYLKNLSKRKQSNHNLSSCIHNNCDLEVPFNKQKTFGDKSFSGGTPPLWNALPYNIKTTTDYETFKVLCKTFLFKEYLIKS